MEDVLQIKHLTKRYGNTVAVDDISFSVKAGEFFGFLGQNGAGKTSTIHSIVGVATITEGAITVCGFDVVSQYRLARMKIGLSPQEFNADVFATPHDILYYVAGYYGLFGKRRAQRVDDMLVRFGLSAYAEKQFRHLSGGLKRRLMLARALVHDPELLILDEPTAGVDVELRHDLWKYLCELNEAGKTIFLTSHYLDEVEMLCDRIAVIHQGKIVALGNKQEFLKDGKRLEEWYLELTQTTTVA